MNAANSGWKKISLHDTGIAAGAMAVQLSAGVPAQIAVSRMGDLQPTHKQAWTDISRMLHDGTRLSEAIEGWWADAYTASVRAGERSDSIAEVMINIEKSITSKKIINKVIWRLAYPLGVTVGGVLLFLNIMLLVLPKFNMPGVQKNSIMQLSLQMNQVFERNGLYIGITLMGLLFVSIVWLSQDNNRQSLIAWFDKIPVVGINVRSLFFGAWAYQMATLDKAGGIPIQQALEYSAASLPKAYRDGMRLMAADIPQRGLELAAMPGKDGEYDPRASWPFYVTLAFRMSAQSRNLGDLLLKFAPAMIEEGTRGIEKITRLLGIGAFALTGALVAVPMSGYFMSIADALKKSFS